MKDNEHLHCSFCGKPEELTNRLIAGPNGLYICDECIEVCRDVMKEDLAKKNEQTEVKLLKPVEIKERLDEYIIGQDEAKKVLKTLNDEEMIKHYKNLVREYGIDGKLNCKWVYV